MCLGARGNVVVETLCYKPEGRGFDLIFSVYLILPTALGPGVYSASSTNDYQKHKEMFLESRARPVRKADSFAAIREPSV
jgi:hypothetical protein